MGLGGINFRATETYVTDPAGTTWCRTDAFSDSQYPTTRGGMTFGWDGTTTAITANNRNSGIDARLAGINYRTNTGTTKGIFRYDLDSTGSHNVYLALGDAASGQSIEFVAKDNTTAFITISSSTGTAQWLDATDTLRTSATDWVNNNAAVARTFGSTILYLEIGGVSGSGNTTIAHLFVETAGSTDALTADDIASSTSVGSPSIGQEHGLTANDIASSSSVTTPAVGQEHALLAVDIASSTSVSTPTLAEVVPNRDDLLAENIASSTSIGTPTVGQTHVLAALDITASTSVGSPSLVSGTRGGWGVDHDRAYLQRLRYQQGLAKDDDEVLAVLIASGLFTRR